MSDSYDAELDEELDDVDLSEEEPEDEDELEPEDQEGDEPSEEDEPPARRPSRGENRVSVATRTAAEAKREAEALRAELAALKAERNTPPRETPEQVRARLEQMDPYDRLQYERQQDRQEFQQSLQRIEFNSQETADKAAYESLCARNPVAAKLKQDVEDRLADMRRNGTTAPRETVLRWVIGDRALANAGRASGRAQRTAATNRDRQQARPGNGRADVAPSNDRGANSKAVRDKRLANYQL